VTPEIHWLLLTVLLSASIWMPYVVDRILVRGLWPAISDRGPENGPHSPWAQRMIRAHANAIENLAIFAPLVLAAHALNVHSAALVTAATVYFFARLAHLVVYTLGLPVLRTIAFAVGWGAQMVFVFALLGAA
jgi:uncharacterized MAPEG superfamily protein